MRLPNMGSIRRPRNPRSGKPYKDRWAVRWYDATGRRRERTIRGPKAGAAAILTRIEHEVTMEAAGLGVLAKQATPARQVYEAWYAEHSRGWSPAHARNVRESMPALLDELDVLEVKDITLRDVLAWRARQTTSHRTRNRRLAYLRAMLRWAVRTRRVAVDPLEGLQPLPVREKHRERVRHALTPDEARRFIGAARAYDEAHPGQVAQAILPEILYGTGLRLGEAVRLRWQDWQGGRLRVAPGKTGDGRTVPVSGELAQRLQETRERRGREIGRLPRPGDLVVLSRRRKPYRTDSKSLRSLWELWRLAAELPAVWPDGSVLDRHAFRHTYCTRLADAGVPVQTAMMLMGHRSARMVTEVYTAREGLSVDGVPLPVVGAEREEAEEA